MRKELKCDKDIIEMKYYFHKLQKTINVINTEISETESEIKMLESATLRELIDRGAWIPFMIVGIRPTDEELEYQKKMKLAGIKSGLSRKRKQLKKVNLYLNFVKNHKNILKKVWLTHKTIDFIMETILEQKKFSRSFVSFNLLPKYMELQEDMSIRNFTASVKFIRINIIKEESTKAV